MFYICQKENLKEPVKMFFKTVMRYGGFSFQFM